MLFASRQFVILWSRTHIMRMQRCVASGAAHRSWLGERIWQQATPWFHRQCESFCVCSKPLAFNRETSSYLTFLGMLQLAITVLIIALHWPEHVVVGFASHRTGLNPSAGSIRPNRALAAVKFSLLLNDGA